MSDGSCTELYNSYLVGGRFRDKGRTDRYPPLPLPLLPRGRNFRLARQTKHNIGDRILPNGDPTACRLPNDAKSRVEGLLGSKVS